MPRRKLRSQLKHRGKLVATVGALNASFKRDVGRETCCAENSIESVDVGDGTTRFVGGEGRV